LTEPPVDYDLDPPDDAGKPPPLPFWAKMLIGSLLCLVLALAGIVLRLA
jgi:hypothetical protein